MIEVKIKNLSPNEIIDIVKDLRQQGLAQGVDFDFEYHKPMWDNFSGVESDRYTMFMFHSEKYATLFALKYGS
jgi:hypothetical protein